MNTEDFTTKYEIDPNKVPLTTLEIQVIVALMSEYGFDKGFRDTAGRRGM